MEAVSTENRARQGDWLLGALVFLFSFIVHASYIFNHFYVHGAYFLDSGLYADMMWRSGFFCMTPEQGHHTTAGMSYFAVHTTILVGIFSLLSNWVSFDHVTWFAVYQGLSFGLLAYSIYFIGRVFYWRPGWGWAIIWTLLPLAFVHSGLAIAVADYPHLEVAACGPGILFFANLIRKAWRQAFLWMFLAVIVREDVGFHLAAILGLHLTYFWFKNESDRVRLRRQIQFLCMALAASLILLVLQKVAFPLESTFHQTYVSLGSEEGGLNRMARNFQRFLEHRAYLWAPWLVAVAWSIVRRDGVLGLALGAYLPWTVLNLHGTREEPGSLFAYYGYPFFFSFAWIVLSPAWSSTIRASRAPWVLLTCCCLSAVALGKARMISFFHNAKPKPEFRQGMLAREVLKKFDLHRETAGRGFVDGAVLSLGEALIPAGSWVSRPPMAKSPSFILTWRDSFDQGHVNRELLQWRQPQAWELGETPLRLLQSEGYLIPEGVRPLLRPVPLVKATQRSVGARELPEGHFEMQPQGENQPQLSLQFLRLSSGKLNLRYTVEIKRLDPENRAIRMLWTGHEEAMETRCNLSPGDAEMAFELRIPTKEPKLEGLLVPPAGAHIIVLDCQLMWEPAEEATVGLSEKGPGGLPRATLEK